MNMVGFEVHVEIFVQVRIHRLGERDGSMLAIVGFEGGCCDWVFFDIVSGRVSQEIGEEKTLVVEPNQQKTQHTNQQKAKHYLTQPESPSSKGPETYILRPHKDLWLWDRLATWGIYRNRL